MISLPDFGQYLGQAQRPLFPLGGVDALDHQPQRKGDFRNHNQHGDIRWRGAVVGYQQLAKIIDEIADGGHDEQDAQVFGKVPRREDQVAQYEDVHREEGDANCEAIVMGIEKQQSQRLQLSRTEDS